MEQVDAILRELADDAADYQREGSLALFVRHGQEIALNLREVPGTGLSVVLEEAGRPQRFIPLHAYLQRDILKLSLLAKQVSRALERAWEHRLAKFVDGPAEETNQGKSQLLDAVAGHLRERLVMAEPGTTNVVQLMARAGQGKTALLEQLAMELARLYKPDPYPSPILLPVDLLGRFVGTVDDAIAGTLNNTYLFPGLSQRDVSLSIRQRWLILALDGFDELVARIGVREAFLRITELLDQLRGSGSVVLSARENFFELYQVTAGIRSYLEPKVGSYTTTAFRLVRWRDEQGLQVFAGLGSEDPPKDLSGLLTAFENDRDIVLHPFFLTRLAALWQQGERFEEAGKEHDKLGRTKYVIDTFLRRESQEKWTSRDGKPLLSADDHTAMLGTIAEEMWRSGAFRLDASELVLAAELGLADLKLPAAVVQEALARVPNHAALIVRDQRYAFLHEKFLQFFLGHRLALLLRRADEVGVAEILKARELGPEVVEWLAWNWRRADGDTTTVVDFLNRLQERITEEAVVPNVGQITGRLLGGHRQLGVAEVKGQTFVGQALSGGDFRMIEFAQCRFWHLDLSETTFEHCVFRNCKIGDVLLSGKTSFKDCKMIESVPRAVEVEDDRTFYAPDEIAELLRRRGAAVLVEEVAEPQEVYLRAGREVGDCVERVVRRSEKTCDVALEDLGELKAKIVKDVVKIGLETGVMKEVSRDASGPKKQFVRFGVDRERLLWGQAASSGDERIDSFWELLGRKYPANR